MTLDSLPKTSQLSSSRLDSSELTVPQSLTHLLAPVTPEAFRDQYQARRHLLLRAAQPRRFEPLLSWQALNEIVRRQRLPTARLDVTHNGELLPWHSYSREAPTARGPRDQLDIAQLNERLRSGATLVINSIDQEHPPIRRLRSALERDLKVHVTVNNYTSWGTTHGFDVHWDDHDTLVLQIHGHKRWDIYGPTRRAPLYDDITPAEPPTAANAESLLLGPGDLLYVPRGFWHDVTPVDEPSVHLTFSLLEHSNADFLKWVVHQLKSNELVRQDIPRCLTLAEQRRVIERLKLMLAESLTASALQEFLQFTGSEASPDPMPSFPYLGRENIARVPAGTRVRLLSPRASVNRTNSHLNLQAGGRAVRLPAAAEGHVEQLAMGETVAVSDLQDELGEGSARQLLAELLGLGLIALERP